MQSLWRTLAQPFRSLWVPQSPHRTYSAKHSAGFCFRKVSPSCTYQQNNAQYKRLYATIYRLLLRSIFIAVRAGKVKSKPEKKNMHNYLIQREVKKTWSELRGKKNVDEWLSFSRFEKRYTTIAQDVSWQMIHSLPRWPKAGIEKAESPVTGHMLINRPEGKMKK